MLAFRCVCEYGGRAQCAVEVLCQVLLSCVCIQVCEYVYVVHCGAPQSWTVCVLKSVSVGVQVVVPECYRHLRNIIAVNIITVIVITILIRLIVTSS